MKYLLVNKSDLGRTETHGTALDAALFLCNKRLSNWIVVKADLHDRTARDVLVDLRDAFRPDLAARLKAIKKALEEA